MNKNKKILGFPLSYAQKRIWFLDNFEKGTSVYNVGAVTEIKISLKYDAYKKIVQTIVDRHDAFRTNFLRTKSGELIQIIHKKRKADISFFDLSQAEESIKQKRKKEIIKTEKQYKFNLEKDQLARIVLIKLEEEKYIFVTVIHHIISDIWSLGIIIEEFYYICQAYFYDQPVNLPNLNIQYKDYAVWESAEDQKALIKEQEKYWLEKLSGDLPQLDLPFDCDRPVEQDYKYDAATIVFRSDKIKEIDFFCKRNNITQFIFFLSVYFLFLSRVSSQEEVLVGTHLANRDQAELENVVGPLLNSLALRMKIDPEKDFTSLIAEVKDLVLSAMENKNYPFEKLVEKLNLPRALNRYPIFSTTFQIFDFQERENITRNLFRGFLQKNNFFDNSLGKFDLAFQVFKTNQGLHLTFNYNTGIFKTETIKCFLKNYTVLLDNVLTQKSESVKNLEIISEKEKKYLLHEFNKTGKKYPKEKTIYELFKEQALIFQTKIAVEYDDKKITYQELDNKVDQWAEYFFDNGIKPGDVLGIFLPNSLEAITAILAVLKVGAIFLPIDVETPAERREYIIKDANAKRVIAFSESEKFIPKDKFLLAIFDAKANKTKSSFEKFGSDSPAAIIYTSGSTGKPKGVVLTHRGIVNHAFAKIQVAKIKTGDSVAHNFSLAFVASLWQIFSPLFIGAKIIVLSKEINREPVLLFKKAVDSQVNILEIIPSALQSFLQVDKKKVEIEKIKSIFLTGETVFPSLVKEFYKRYNTQLINAYGQTECSDDTLHYLFPKNFENKIILGTPSANTQVYILDSALKLRPTGVWGELYISGDCLSLGYRGKPELTEKVFLPHPFIPNSKIYKTGDWGRLLPGEEIEFLERSADRLKVRGHRIEIKEIVNTLIEYRAIKNCFVLAGPMKGLVVYYSADEKILPEVLHEYLEKKLPSYMIPAFYVQIKNWPRTIAGKIDKELLPAPEDKHRARAEYTESKSESELDIKAVWQKVLAIEKIGVDDDFFKLGGHSLLALQVLADLRARGYMVSLPQLFRFTKIRSLAVEIKKKEKKAGLENFFGGTPFTALGDYLLANAAGNFIYKEELEISAATVDRKILIKAIDFLKEKYYETKIIYTDVPILKKTDEVGMVMIFLENKIIIKRNKKTLAPEKFTEILLHLQKKYNQILADTKAENFTPFSSYPGYYQCLHSSVLEYLRYKTNKFFYKSLLPALDLFCLPSYFIFDNGVRTNIDFISSLLGYKNLFLSVEALGIGLEFKKFKNLTTALAFYTQAAEAEKIVLAIGNNYFLPGSAFYKNEDFIKITQAGLNFFPINISIFFGELKALTVYSPNLNYFGRIEEEDFVNYWKNFSDFDIQAKNQLKQFGAPFKILQIKGADSVKSHTLDDLYTALEITIKEYFKDREVLAKTGFKQAFFGKEAIKAFQEEINKKEIPDILIIDLLKRLQKPWLFLRDLICDISSLNEDFGESLNKIGEIIDLWESNFSFLHEKIKKKKIVYEPILSIAPDPKLYPLTLVSPSDRQKLLSNLKVLEEKEILFYRLLQKKLKNINS